MSDDPQRKRRRFGLNLSPEALDILFTIGAVATALGGAATLTDRGDVATLTPMVIGSTILVAVAGFSDWWVLTDEELHERSKNRPFSSTLRMALFASSTALAVVAVLRMAAGDGSWFTRFVLPAVIIVLSVVGFGHALARRSGREAPDDT